MGAPSLGQRGRESPPRHRRAERRVGAEPHGRGPELRSVQLRAPDHALGEQPDRAAAADASCGAGLELRRRPPGRDRRHGGGLCRRRARPRPVDVRGPQRRDMVRPRHSALDLSLDVRVTAARPQSPRTRASSSRCGSGRSQPRASAARGRRVHGSLDAPRVARAVRGDRAAGRRRRRHRNACPGGRARDCSSSPCRACTGKGSR